jgi:hypothetical protein
MEYLQTISEHLAQEGFRPKTTLDGEIMFHHMGKTCFLQPSTKTNLIRIITCDFKPLSPKTQEKAMSAAISASASTKATKIFISDDNEIWAVLDLLLPNPEIIILIFQRAMNAFHTGISKFEKLFPQT